MSERKYRQRGYQDHDGDAPRKHFGGPYGPRPERPEGPWGRGLGKPTATVFRCAVCGHRQRADIRHATICAKCSTDLHTCTHCTHFDTSVARQCRHPEAALIESKAKRNDCAFFTPKKAQEFAPEPKDSGPKSKGQAAFDALFKD